MLNVALAKELEDRFKCVRCGVCCTNDFLRIITADEMDRILDFVNDHEPCGVVSLCLPLSDIPGSYSMNAGSACPFYDGIVNECIIYEVRPECCRKFPIQSLYEGRGSLECSMSCLGFFTACANMLEVPAYCSEVK